MLRARLARSSFLGFRIRCAGCRFLIEQQVSFAVEVVIEDRTVIFVVVFKAPRHFRRGRRERATFFAPAR
jgi:hypothetical protein